MFPSPFPPARRVALQLAAVLVLMSGPATQAAPFTPANDAEVVERLPAGDPALQRAEALRRQVAAQPRNTALRIEVARRYFDLAQAQGEPRYAGYAMGVLAPLRAVPPGHAGYWLVRAQLEQYQQDFDAALASLARAAQLDRRSTEPLAWRAAIFMVQARYPEALDECQRLTPLADPLWATACRAYARAATGALQPAYDALLKALAEAHGDAPPTLQLWVLVRLAGMAQRLDLPAQAEHHFQQAQALRLADPFLQASHADFLLAQGRPAEVLSLLAGSERSDALLLRLALAARAVGDPRTGDWTRQLRQRFEAARQRGDRLHDDEAARFALEIEQRPERAVRLAAANYIAHREPHDALILMRAALAAKQPAAAAPALAWLQASRYEDPALASLAEQLQAAEVRQ